MIASAKQYAQVLFEMTKDADEKSAQEAVKKFVDALIRNNQVSQLEKILANFSTLWNKEKGVINAEITTAKDIDGKVDKMLSEYINRVSNGSGQKKQILITRKKDEKIIGGFVLKYGDKILNQSIKARLQQLKKQMAK